MVKKTIKKIVNNKFFLLFCVLALLFVLNKGFYSIETMHFLQIGDGTEKYKIKSKTYYLFGKPIYIKEG